MYIAKQIENNEEYYEIFLIESATTPEGDSTEVLKSVGSFKKDELENQIINLQAGISDLQSKIAAITKEELQNSIVNLQGEMSDLESIISAIDEVV